MNGLNLTIINKPREEEPSFLQQMLLDRRVEHCQQMDMFAEMLQRLKSMDSHTSTHHAGGG